ncbi:GSCOCT00014088001.2-RA-CDS [Cotesia congregata]|uniref:Odorant receptor n=1 Tax=Cotesia congregata TaxID=51543 RepID=A0A8J2HMW3_COTCN|nr:GSCOCT00014088001.2-RA-CDS [Cotesia congregata]CAG5106414.1 olfactory receptor 143 [Cotesia congregata]
MDIYERPYYKITKSFASFIGQWPYQSRLQRLVLEFLLWNLFIIQVVPQVVVSLVDNFQDLDVVLELLSAFIMDLAYAAKYLNAILKAELIKRLFEKIREDWRILRSDHEKLILEYHLKMGQYLSIGYTGFANLALLVFILDPIFPIIIDKVSKSNDTLPRRFAVPMEFVVCDQQKYYWSLLGVSNFCIISIIMVIVCCDVLFISFVQHVCGIFAVVGFRIEHAPNVIIPHEILKGSNFGSNYQDVHYRHLVTCIRDHRRAFAEMIETTFTGSFGIVVGLNLPIMSITAVQIMAETNSIQDTVKNIMFTGAQLVHLFFDCYMSQRLTDMSSHIHDCITRAKWYEISTKSRKLLILMTLRSQVPCKLTAAKIMDLSIESFGVCVKTAGSYFTMLMSMR